jgi:hypothetical protein
MASVRILSGTLVGAGGVFLKVNQGYYCNLPIEFSLCRIRNCREDNTVTTAVCVQVAVNELDPGLSVLG